MIAAIERTPTYQQEQVSRNEIPLTALLEDSQYLLPSEQMEMGCLAVMRAMMIVAKNETLFTGGDIIKNTLLDKRSGEVRIGTQSGRKYPGTPADRNTDQVKALGKLLYKATSPYDDEAISVERVRGSFSNRPWGDVAYIIERAITNDPALQYKDVHEMRDDIVRSSLMGRLVNKEHLYEPDKALAGLVQKRENEKSRIDMENFAHLVDQNKLGVLAA